jgi:hypothetical protein
MKRNILLLLLTANVLISNCAGATGAREALEQLIGFTVMVLCPIWDPDGTKYAICPKRGAHSPECKTCPSGSSLGEVSPGSTPTIDPTDPIGVTTQANCTWKAKTPSSQCGYTPANTNTCKIVACSEFKSVLASVNQLGYDLTASDPPVGVRSINPASNQIIYENQNIDIQFAGSVKSDSISFSGSMNPELNPNFRFRRAVDYNDTLPLAAGSKWSLGAAKTLTISVLDINDNPVVVPLLYHVIKAGSSKTPSFNDCSGGCKPGWQNAYSIQFNATGGVPPYRWVAASSLPPGTNVPSGSLPPGASMTQDGLLSGPATNNFMPNAVYVFGVAVIDSVGQIDVKIITIDTTDVGAQLAACLLLGLCG